MSTPILRQNQGSVIVATASALGSTLASTTTNGTYSSAIRINNSSLAALLMDVWLAGSFGSSPAGAGALQLALIARDNAGTIGPTPSSSILGKFYTFTPSPSGTGTLVYKIEAIPLPYDCDVYIVNNSTGQTFTFQNSLNSSADALLIQPWSPGT
jgi:hypothetical protein